MKPETTLSPLLSAPSQNQNGTNARKSFSDNSALLRYLYEDLARISQVASDTIVLHPADRAATSPPKPPIRGIHAVQAHEEALIAATGGTLVMDVQSITANDNFGAVLGILRATAGGTGENLAVPFCGVWRFEEGRAVEHWENASNIEQFANYMMRNAT